MAYYIDQKNAIIFNPQITGPRSLPTEADRHETTFGRSGSWALDMDLNPLPRADIRDKPISQARRHGCTHSRLRTHTLTHTNTLLAEMKLNP